MQKFYHLTFFIINYVLSETMHDVSNPLVPNKIQDLFLPTSCVDSYNTRSLMSIISYAQIQSRDSKICFLENWGEIVE